jgi:hypothetical protein
MMTATPEPVPPPPIHDIGPFIRSEKWEAINPGHDRYLRKKRRKKTREAWRQ